MFINTGKLFGLGWVFSTDEAKTADAIVRAKREGWATGCKYCIEHTVLRRRLVPSSVDSLRRDMKATALAYGKTEAGAAAAQARHLCRQRAPGHKERLTAVLASARSSGWKKGYDFVLYQDRKLA